MSLSCKALARLTGTLVRPQRRRLDHDPVRPPTTHASEASTVSRALRVVAFRNADRARRRTAEARPRSRFVAPLLSLISVGALGVGLALITSVSALGVLSADLPDPTQLDRLSFAQPTVVYDRDGNVELGRFERERRRVVSYPEIPKTRPGCHDHRRGPLLLGERR
jgi:hypothetical protein